VTPEERLEKLKRLKELRAMRAAQQPLPDEPWHEDFSEGFKASLLSTKLGIKDLRDGITDEERQQLAALKQDAGQSGWGLGGRVAGEVAQMALPGGLLLKAASKGGRMLPLASEMLTAGGFGAVQLPEEDETRLGRATEYVAGAGVGGVLGKALRPLIGQSATRLSDEAQELIKRGVYLTPGMASQSRLMQGLESIAEVTPFFARATKRTRRSARRSWSEAAIRESLPESLQGSVTRGGLEGAEQAIKASDDAFDRAWGNISGINIPDYSRNALSRYYLTKAQRNKIKAVIRDAKELQNNTPGVSAAQIDRMFGNLENQALRSGEKELADAVASIRNQIRGQLPQDQQALLAAIRSKWPEQLVMRKAVANAINEGGVFEPKHLLAAARSVGGDTKIGLGTAPLQDMGMFGAATVGKDIGGQPLEWFRRVAGMVPSPFGLRSGGKFMTAQYGFQQSIDDIMRRYFDTGRTMVGPYRLGAAWPYEDEEY
jgi:hypothetical protein